MRILFSPWNKLERVLVSANLDFSAKKKNVRGDAILDNNQLELKLCGVNGKENQLFLPMGTASQKHGPAWRTVSGRQKIRDCPAERLRAHPMARPRPNAGYFLAIKPSR
ncbi:MAG: hypothetical protein GXP01_00325 [Alphaproteobacteria bacterium]|nr:hypothetical protein [Alphaproteobacteria bacterium]